MPRTRLLATVALALLSTSALADQTALGPWNGAADALARQSALVTSSMALIQSELPNIRDATLRRETTEVVTNPGMCLQSRANLTPARKQELLAKLVSEGLVDEAEGGRIPGGLLAGVFPGVRDDGTDCPKMPMPYAAAPGSAFGGHHSQPGGLPVHVAVNLTSALHLAETYRRVYGTLDAKGMPVAAGAGQADADLLIDGDIVRAAPIWHDFAKTIVFQWNADGSEYVEMNFGGNGKTDAWGAAGSSKTGAHHIIGVAEAMARGLPPAFVIAQASAHSAPNPGAEYNVVNWLRTAAILAGQDPVARGYLVQDATGRLRLAPVRQLGSVNIQGSLPNQPNMLYEYVLHNLSDADYTFTGPAAAQADLFLRMLAPKFGYDPADATRYNTAYRNPVLTHFAAERLQILYAAGGMGRVEQEVAKLKAAGLLQ